MSDSNCCFLIHIQVSQETGKVVCYSHFFKNFPKFVCVIHTYKGFSVVNEAEVDVFLELPCFLHDPKKVVSLISGSSMCFLNPTCTSEKSQFMYSWNLAWRILSITLLAYDMSTSLQ